jgi:hypothetical protein
VTDLTANAILADTLIYVTSTSGMIVGDVIGVVLTDKTIHWTTIATIPGLTSLTLTLALTGPAASGNYVYTYTTALPRILRVLDARRRTGLTTNINDIGMSTIAYQEYQQLPAKQNQGTPTQFTFKPTATAGTFYVWGAPSDGSERIMFTYERVAEDVLTTNDDFDLPPEWCEPVAYQLALRLARPFGKPSAINDLMPLASSMLQNLLDWDNERAYVEFTPSLRDY